MSVCQCESTITLRIAELHVIHSSLEAKPEIYLQSLLEHATGCDIMTDFMGSDHAPVWLDLKMDELPTQKDVLPKLESKARFRVKGKGNFV